MAYTAVHKQHNELSEPARHTDISSLPVPWYTFGRYEYSPLYYISFVFVIERQPFMDSTVVAYGGYRESITACAD